MCLKALLLSGLLTLACGVDMKFPPHFLFGAATSAYQVEGGWNASGKGVSQWDHWVHSHPETIFDRSTGDVATDSYNKWKLDVDACVKLGLQFYRFSISWTRILPTGFTNHINKDGVNYYNNLINGLLKHNIQPMVTLYHWDLPQKLQDLGGWTNPLIADWFASYAELAFSLFADRVPFWITINEPAVICEFTYSTYLAPCLNERLLGPYVCNKNILLAHAKAWRAYDEKFKHLYHGRVSIANHLVWFQSADGHENDLTELAQEFLTGRFSHPIYSREGGWPPKIEKLMAKLSKEQGFNNSRLPPFTDEEKELIRGTYDFYGMNHYTSRIVRQAHPGEDLGIWFMSGSPELNVVIAFDPNWRKGSSVLFAVYPKGIRRQLSWLKRKYGDLDIIITENGYSNSDLLMNDQERIEFIYQYLEQILLSIKVDNVNVLGYTYWSLIDNFEWMDGYSNRFGLFEVDYKDPNLRRTPRDSARYYYDIIKTKTLIAPAVYLKQIDNNSRFKQNGLVFQNGGRNVKQNGDLIINVVALILLVVVVL